MVCLILTLEKNKKFNDKIQKKRTQISYANLIPSFIAQKAEKEVSNWVEKWNKRILFRIKAADKARLEANELYTQQKYEEAIKKYKYSIEMDKTKLYAYNGYGNSLLALNQYEKTIKI